MAKKVQAYVKLQIPAGKANPSPPVGPALGQEGVNIMEFCKEFNAATQKLEPGMPIPVVITVYSDRSLHLHHQDAARDGADQEGRRHRVGPARHRTPRRSARSPSKQVEEIAKIKMPDLNAGSMEAAMRLIAGSARSMGIDVVEK